MKKKQSRVFVSFFMLKYKYIGKGRNKKIEKRSGKVDGHSYQEYTF